MFGMYTCFALNSNLILLILFSGSRLRRRKKTLNSNLILLIHDLLRSMLSPTIFFKFQSDSINTSTRDNLFLYILFFKFQSDSINTTDREASNNTASAFKFQSDSINTFLYHSMPKCGTCFKFQSDSINTVSCVAFGKTAEFTLNSNLILLIHFVLAALFQPLFDFKFQSDSINTADRSLPDVP